MVDLRSLAPFDDETVAASVGRTGRAVVIHEAAGFCGYGAEVVARLTEQCFHHLAAPILRVTGFDIPYPPPKLEAHHLPSVERILDTIDRLQWDDDPPADDRRPTRARDARFRLPDLGEGLTEAEVVTWHVQVGDTVTVDQPVVDVETAKATVEVPSPFAGVVGALHAAVGDVVAVGAALITVAAVRAQRDRPARDHEASGNVLIGYGTSATAADRRAGTADCADPDPATRPRRARGRAVAVSSLGA